MDRIAHLRAHLDNRVYQGESMETVREQDGKVLESELLMSAKLRGLDLGLRQCAYDADSEQGLHRQAA